MTRFELAVQDKQWEVVCLYLLLGVSEAASKLPADALDELLDLLSAAPEPARHRRRHRDG